jgi:hypothetical protein
MKRIIIQLTVEPGVDSDTLLEILRSSNETTMHTLRGLGMLKKAYRADVRIEDIPDPINATS